jgi:ABC-type multidrug transport system fused ATPase/permease subunit
VSKAGTLAAGLVGFSLTNATGLTDTILQVVRSMNNLEVELQSFERVKEYSEIASEEVTDDTPQEDKDVEPRRKTAERVIPDAWPRTGTIELRNVTVRYDLDGPDILKDVNLKFEAGERVAVVGRTGSGKSTLVLSLLRFTHVVSGQILYDGVDITSIPRKQLRQGLTIIPQDAVLFNGTVGSNLDPSGEIPSTRLQQALEACSDIASFQFHGEDCVGRAKGDPDRKNSIGAYDSAGRPPTGDEHAVGGISISTPVLPNGENFSHGQRQVLSLCRALVRSSKLMLLDEATASMDYETDRGIQVVLRRQLSGAAAGGDRQRTLVTIAHRLRTIVDYDEVVVMGGGRVLEVGSPRELCEARGQFWEMVRHSGEGDDLENLMLGEERP